MRWQELDAIGESYDYWQSTRNALFSPLRVRLRDYTCASIECASVCASICSVNYTILRSFAIRVIGY